MVSVSRMIEPLYPPQSPRLDVMTRTSDFFTGRATSKGCDTSPAFFARSAASSEILRVNASASVARSSAFLKRAVAMSSIVRVIFRMFRTALRRFTRARRLAISHSVMSDESEVMRKVRSSSDSSLMTHHSSRVSKTRHTIRGDDEDQVFVAQAVVAPDHLHPPPVRQPAVALDAGLGLVPPSDVGAGMPRELNLVGTQAVQIQLRKVPVDPDKLCHASFLFIAFRVSRSTFRVQHPVSNSKR